MKLYAFFKSTLIYKGIFASIITVGLFGCANTARQEISLTPDTRAAIKKIKLYDQIIMPQQDHLSFPNTTGGSIGGVWEGIWYERAKEQLPLVKGIVESYLKDTLANELAKTKTFEFSKDESDSNPLLIITVLEYGYSRAATGLLVRAILANMSETEVDSIATKAYRKCEKSILKRFIDVANEVASEMKPKTLWSLYLDPFKYGKSTTYKTMDSLGYGWTTYEKGYDDTTCARINFGKVSKYVVDQIVTGLVKGN